MRLRQAPELVFFRHPGLGAIQSYWELGWHRDPVVMRALAGEVRQAGVVIAIPDYPPGWAPGRYLDVLPRTDSHPEGWADVTVNVQLDTQRGLARCPERLRERYFHTAIAVGAATLESARTILHQSARFWFEKEREAATESAERMDTIRRLGNLIGDLRAVLGEHARVCLINNCAVCRVSAELAEVKL